MKRHNILSWSIFELAKTLDPMRRLKVACTLKLHVHKSCHSGFFLKLQWFHRIRKITSSVRHYVRSARKRYSFWWSYRRNQSKLEVFFIDIFLKKNRIKYHSSIFDICSLLLRIFVKIYAFVNMSFLTTNIQYLTIIIGAPSKYVRWRFWNSF